MHSPFVIQSEESYKHILKNKLQFIMSLAVTLNLFQHLMIASIKTDQILKLLVVYLLRFRIAGSPLSSLNLFHLLLIINS